jgi:hypothetical protein
MKHLNTIFILIITLVAINASCLKAQSLQLSQHDTLVTQVVDDEFASWALVKNISSASVDVKFKIAVLKIPFGEKVLPCFAGYCFDPFTTDFESTGSITLAANESLTTVNGLHIKLQKMVEGTTILYVTFFNAANVNDTVGYTLTFVRGTADVKELMLSNINLSNAVPNPAISNVSINYDVPNFANNASIELYNSMGEYVNTYKLEQSKGVLSVDVASYPQGKYFYILKVNGEAIKTQNFIIAR